MGGSTKARRKLGVNVYVDHFDDDDGAYICRNSSKCTLIKYIEINVCQLHLNKVVT